MLNRIVLVVLASMSLGAHAFPIIAFDTSQFDTSAVAVAGGQADAQFDSSPPSTLPSIASAAVVDATRFAGASGVGANGLLNASSEASATSGVASAAGTSQFVGTFVVDQAYRTLLRFSFGTQDFTDSPAFSAGSVFVLVTAGNTVYLDQVITAPGSFAFDFGIPVGARVTIDLLLSSESSLTSGGNAANLASLSYGAFAIPEPSTLLLLALAGLVAVARRTRPSR